MNRERLRSVLLLAALCPALAAASTAWAGLALGLLSAVLLLLSGLLWGILRRSLPERAGFLSGMVISAALTAVAAALTHAFLPGIWAVTGEYFPLLAAQGVLLNAADAEEGGLSLSPGGLAGYVVVLLLTGAAREFLGAGALFGCPVLCEGLSPVSAISGAPGAFLAIAFAGMILNALGLLGKEGKA